MKSFTGTVQRLESEAVGAGLVRLAFGRNVDPDQTRSSEDADVVVHG